LLALCCLILNANVFAQWTKKADARYVRSDVPGSVVYNGKLYVFFGFYDSTLHILSNSEVYNPAQNTWTLLNPIPAGKAASHQGVLLIDNTVWHIGGRVGNHPGPLTNEIWIYNISSDSWSQGPSLVDPATGKPIKWAAGGVALIGRTLHLFGGMIETACNSDQSKYHLTLNIDEWLLNPGKPAPWKNTKAIMPVARNHFATVVLGGKIYALGGQFGHDCYGGQDQKYSHVYDPATDKWKELPLMSAPRSHCDAASFAMDGKIYLVGGQGLYGSSVNYVTVFNPLSNNGVGTWTNDNNLVLPTVYEGMSAKLINNEIIISHGGVGTSRKPQKLTFSRTMARTPVYKLLFSSDTLNLRVAPGKQLDTSAVLFTIDGTKNYSLSSNASWLKVTKNSTGLATANGRDITLSASAATLATGRYQATLTATGTGTGATYQPAVMKINLVVCSSSNTSDLCNGVDDDCDGFVDEDCLPKINIDSPTVNEGNSGTRSVRFKVTLDKSSTVPVSVQYATQNSSASTADYVSKSGTLTFAPNTREMYIDVTVKGDVIDEWNEAFRVLLSKPVNGVLGTSMGFCPIVDDDPLPYLVAADTMATENSLAAQVRVRLSAVSGKIIDIKYDTKNGSAVSPADYTAIVSGSLTFSAGELTKYVTVPIKKDAVTEGNETFQLVLKSPVNVSISAPGKPVATITIKNAAGALAVGEDGSRITAFPNPFVSESGLLIEGGSSAIVRLRVDDLLGRHIESRMAVLSGGVLKIGAGWQPGVYVVRVFEGRRERVFKMVKMK
jgi:N-acetylneuraminic acid mutarotase